MPQTQAAPRSRWLPYAFGALVGVILGLSVLVYGLWSNRLGRLSTVHGADSLQALLRSGADPAANVDLNRRNAIVAAVEMARNSVVTISAVGPREVNSQYPDLFALPFRFRRVVPMQWIGSGFLIDDGYVVTTEHVVRDATHLVVSLGNGSSAHAELVGTAPRFDIALLRVGADAVRTTARLGDSEDLLVGEWAIAIGSPFGNQLDDPQPSVSVGVISAIDRDIRPPADFQGSWPYFRLLQTDAAINEGNSGGPLVNSAGEIIGLNMAIVSTSAGQTNVGVNFSIPINTVKWVTQELRDFGEVRSPWVGWHLDEAVPPAVRRQIHLSESQGVLVVGAVDPGGPAERAGIEPGDTLLSLNQQDPYSRARADRILFDARVGGGSLDVMLLRARDGQRLHVMVDVIENPRTKREREQRARPLG